MLDTSRNDPERPVGASWAKPRLAFVAALTEAIRDNVAAGDHEAARIALCALNSLLAGEGEGVRARGGMGGVQEYEWVPQRQETDRPLLGDGTTVMAPDEAGDAGLRSVDERQGPGDPETADGPADTPSREAISEERPGGQDAVQQVPAGLARQIMDYCCGLPRRLREIAAYLKMQQRDLAGVVEALVREGRLRLTLPTLPRSRFQRYAVVAVDQTRA